MYIDDFVSKPHIFVFLNIQEKQNTDGNTFYYFNVFDVDLLQF